MSGADGAAAHNVQTGNVGNRGDILKHAALLHLARMLLRSDPREPVNYLDTHAFLLHAPPANRAWCDHVQTLAAAHKGYGLYQALQQGRVVNGDYLCSTGVVAATLPEARLYLSESDPATRALLQRQMHASGRAAVILNDVEDWRTWPGSRPDGPLLALIDPFALSAAHWSSATAAVEGFTVHGARGPLLAFNYDRQARVTWPPPPRGWRGPVAQMHAMPYFLCAYATPDLAEATLETLAALGWQHG